MPTIHNDVLQGELAWELLRLGKPTASDFKALLTPQFVARKGEGVKTFLAEKVAEAWFGRPLPRIGAWAMEQGTILEDFARPFYELTFNEAVKTVGFITSDDGRCGCSPDGLIGDDGGLELKCPLLKTHIRYILEGELPEEYVTQVHGSLYVSGRKWWRFMSYYRNAPPFVLTIERDEAIMQKIDAALKAFYIQFDAAMLKLKAL